MNGIPGSGKTTFARVLSNYLGFLYVEFSFSKEAKSFDWMLEHIQYLKNTVILIDEIDRIIAELKDNTNDKSLGFVNTLMKFLESPNLDGTIIVLTTNKNPKDFDNALIRSGRVDYIEYFGHCNSQQFNEIFQYFTDTSVPKSFIFPEGTFSPADIINKICIPYRKDPEKILQLVGKNKSE